MFCVAGPEILVLFPGVGGISGSFGCDLQAIRAESVLKRGRELLEFCWFFVFGSEMVGSISEVCLVACLCVLDVVFELMPWS